MRVTTRRWVGRETPPHLVLNPDGFRFSRVQQQDGKDRVRDRRGAYRLRDLIRLQRRENDTAPRHYRSHWPSANAVLLLSNSIDQLLKLYYVCVCVFFNNILIQPDPTERLFGCQQIGIEAI